MKRLTPVPDGPAPRRPTMASERPRSLESLIHGASPALDNLTRAARSRSDLLDQVRCALGSPLGPNVCAASFEENTLTLVVRSPAWATNLRLSASSLAPSLAEACGLEVQRVAVKVRPGALSPD